jgi:hypothetical protein
VEGGDFKIPNRNLDTGELTRAGQYRLADQSYRDLVRRLAKKHFADLTPDLKSSILAYFGSGSVGHDWKKHKWKETERDLTKLKEVAPLVP